MAPARVVNKIYILSRKTRLKMTTKPTAAYTQMCTPGQLACSLYCHRDMSLSKFHSICASHHHQKKVRRDPTESLSACLSWSTGSSSLSYLIGSSTLSFSMQTGSMRKQTRYRLALLSNSMVKRGIRPSCNPAHTINSATGKTMKDQNRPRIRIIPGLGSPRPSETIGGRT